MDELNDLRQRIAQLEEELAVERIMREAEGDAYRRKIAELERSQKNE